MELIIDRIENGIAVCEKPDKTMTEIPLDALPPVREGDCIVITVDNDKKKQLHKKISDLMDSVWEN